MKTKPFFPSLCALLAAVLLLVPPAPAADCRPGQAAAPVSRLVLISIDGLRPDAIERAGASHMQRLIRSGLYFPNARTVEPSTTLPGHVSMLTGLAPERHGRTGNQPSPDYVPQPTVFSVATAAGKKTAMLYSKELLAQIASPETLAFAYGPGLPGVGYGDAGAEKLAAVFAETWPKSDFAFTFIHIREADRAGHKHAWMSPQYLDAVRTADRAVGAILDAIERSGRSAATAAILTADHGGEGTTHWSARPEDTTIPWVYSGPGIGPQTCPEAHIRIYDTAPTALELLGLKPPPEMDGRPIPELTGMTQNRR